MSDLAGELSMSDLAEELDLEEHLRETLRNITLRIDA